MNSSFAIDIPDTLLARARRGDAVAQEQIYRRFERPVYTLALRLLGNPDAALDALQDVFVAVFRGLPTFRGEAPFWGWLRQIAVRSVLAALHQQKRDAARELPDDELAEVVDTTAPPLHLTLDLERALAALPPITRSVIWLQLVEGLSHAEIATQFGQSPSFSKSQLARGLKQLRALLATEAPCPTLA